MAGAHDQHALVGVALPLTAHHVWHAVLDAAHVANLSHGGQTIGPHPAGRAPGSRGVDQRARLELLLFAVRTKAHHERGLLTAFRLHLVVAPPGEVLDTRT